MDKKIVELYNRKKKELKELQKEFTRINQLDNEVLDNRIEKVKVSVWSWDDFLNSRRF